MQSFSIDQETIKTAFFYSKFDINIIDFFMKLFIKNQILLDEISNKKIIVFSSVYNLDEILNYKSQLTVLNNE